MVRHSCILSGMKGNVAKLGNGKECSCVGPKLFFTSVIMCKTETHNYLFNHINWGSLMVRIIKTVCCIVHHSEVGSVLVLKIRSGDLGQY